MNGNKRGLRLLLVLVIIAALVYVIKNQRNNAGSYETPPRQAKIENNSGELAERDNTTDGFSRVLRGDIRINSDFK